MELIKEDEKIFWAHRTVKLSWIKYTHENSSIDRKDIWSSLEIRYKGLL